MTPLEFAQNLARSADLKDRALGIGIVARGLSDDDPANHKQGWPLETAVEQAAKYLGLEPTPELLAEATKVAPTISDAMLNRH